MQEQSPGSRQPTAGPCVLVIRDGWGRNPHPEHDAFNAVKLATTPIADGLENEWPTTLVKTSGEDVGLPIGPKGPVMGNSEVGHQNIGAGRIVDQELMRITQSIRSGDFFENVGLDDAFCHVESTGGAVHLVGLVSDGQVHSDIEHLLALIMFARRRGCPREGLRVHAITDGRDTPPTSGRSFIGRLEEALENAGYDPVASVLGRYWAMDRDNRWPRVERAFRCLVGPAELLAESAVAALERHYAHPEDLSLRGDEFMPPTAIGNEETSARTRIHDGDSIIFFNFRGDRPREIARAFVYDDEEFSKVERGGFKRVGRPSNIRFTGLTRYESNLPIEVAFEKPPKMESILGETIANHGMAQFRCAETEKFPHVTFFFNDYREDPFDNERRNLIPSPTDISTYDKKPEMSAIAVRDAVIERLESDDCEQLIVVNFANGDMVGHTGNLEAAVAACEIVDSCTGSLIDATLARGGALIITADHGNAEQMWNPEGECPHTAHTNYDVPLHVVGTEFRGANLRGDGRLADIAPTVLEILGLEKPAEMTGESLLA